MAATLARRLSLRGPMRLSHRGLARRRASTLTSAVAWGDTSTWWDWSARCLTLSAEAAGLPMEACGAFRRIWDKENSFVTRAHGATFVRPHHEIHMRVPSVVVVPRLARVSARSFAWACDVVDERDGAVVATTHGTFVHVDVETHARTVPLPEAVVEELRPLATGEPRPPPLSAAFSDDARRIDWTTTVRQSDSDDFHHVNNAKWALLSADALLEAKRGVAAPTAVLVEYLRAARPGDALTATVADGADGAARLALLADGAEAAVVVEYKF